jgi:hypothetical protein
MFNIFLFMLNKNAIEIVSQGKQASKHYSNTIKISTHEIIYADHLDTPDHLFFIRSAGDC